ncbi:MAG: hypothetical protein IJ848_03305 [Alphaproteobacteria bacterium]|nr:hypothetical protein [Alphaproteobacteria bacterium]
MDVLYKLEKIGNLSLALGFFDGIHLGHQAVINNTVLVAKHSNIKSAVITFNKSPKYVFDNNVKTIITNDIKIKLISRLNIDYLFFLDFNKLRHLSAIDYIKLLVEYFSPFAITTGFNYSFGYQKSGNTELLSNMSSMYNYHYFEIGAVKYNNTVVSSTLIRKLIEYKQYKEAELLLGHHCYNL